MRGSNHLSDLKINLDYTPSEEDLAYRKMMTSLRPKFIAPPPSTKQTDSVNRVMAMSDKELEAHRNRTIDVSKAQIRDDKGNIFINERHVDLRDAIAYEELRRGAKNQLGESKKSIASDEQKERARQAYVCTPAAPLNEVDFERLTKMERIEELKDKLPQEDKPTFFDKLKRVLFGDPVHENMSYMDLQEWFKQREDKDKK
jgi:hypothetical protein